MPLPLYLAMTAAEISKNSVLPEHFAYMACHFSPYGTGLSNLPGKLPVNSMLILNDRIPIHGHDPERICEQLTAVIERDSVCAVLLDLERPPTANAVKIVRKICNTLPCPVGVSAPYAENLDAPVFMRIDPHAESWDTFQGREIWLDAALEKSTVCITKDGAQVVPTMDIPEPLPFFSERLSSHYGIQLCDDHVYFHFSRNKDDILHFMAQARNITCAVGLWQQLKD